MSDKLLLTTEDDGAVRVLTLNRPDKLNALNTELTQALYDALHGADVDPGVRAIVLAGEGRAFCAGADVTEFAALTPDNQNKVIARADLTVSTQTMLQKLRKPVVSVVQGAALGGGAGLAIGCDMMVVADDVKLGYPELRHSIVPAIVMTSLQRQFGRKLAFELLSTGRTLHADELAERGVANRVASVAQARSVGIGIAEGWAQASPSAMSAAKGLFYRVADLPFEQAMQAGRDVNTIMRGFRGA